MGLFDIDITKIKRISLKEIKLPKTEQRAEVINPVLVERPPTDEDIIYSKLVDSHPFLETFVDLLGLVSITTGERFKKVNNIDYLDLKDQEIKPKLIDLAKRVVEEEKSYRKDEIIKRIQEITKVNYQRAEKGFNLMLKAGAIEGMDGKYYLMGSTPF